MSRQCRLCDSYAINSHLDWRRDEPDFESELCDQCVWRIRACATGRGWGAAGAGRVSVFYGGRRDALFAKFVADAREFYGYF